MLIDTGTYIDSTLTQTEETFEIAKLINLMKNDPYQFFSDDPHAVSEENETLKVEVKLG